MRNTTNTYITAMLILLCTLYIVVYATYYMMLDTIYIDDVTAETDIKKCRGFGFKDRYM